MAARLLGHSTTSVAERYAGLSAAAVPSRDAEAGSKLDDAMADLAIDVATRRLAAYRAYVGATVEVVSPVLLRACEVHGLDIDDLAWRMQPAGVWPQWLCGRRKWNAARLPRSLPDDPWRDVGGLDRQTFIGCGLVLRPDGDRRRGLGLRVLKQCLDMGAVDGGAKLRTMGSRVELAVPHVFPETLVIAMRGRPLDAIIEHPFCRGLGLVIECAGERRRGTTLLTLRCEPVAWRFPWARDDAVEPEGGGQRT